MKPEDIELFDRIAEGVRKAFDKLLHERAANNDTVVISENGVIMHVPAKDLLKKHSEESGKLS